MLESPITFTLNCDDPSPVDENTACEWTVTNVVGAKSVSFDSASGLFKITIENGSGQTLPSTGGIGTTIFYIGGSVLVLAAAILLITKRRMSSND